LLQTSVALKRKKARLIRTHELGHKYVFVHEQKKPLGENVNRRAKLTQEERKEEAEEIKEFAIFIKSNPRQLARSSNFIRATLHKTLAEKMAPKTQEQMKALVKNAQEGNSEAFEDLVRATQNDVYTLAYRLTNNKDDARDVAQEAYLRAFRSLKRFRGDSKFSTWMYRITANCASTYLKLRTKYRHDDLENDELFDEKPESSPDTMAEVGDLRERVTMALADLTPILRAVVVLRDVYDGITESAAKVRLHRARRKLRERLFPMPGEEKTGEVQPE
jgi:RNA polymerase sigma-70 factor, ECF subfamily